MAENELLNRMYHAILEWFVEHGRAPHYVELAHRLDWLRRRHAARFASWWIWAFRACGSIRTQITLNPSRRSPICRRST